MTFSQSLQASSPWSFILLFASILFVALVMERFLFFSMRVQLNVDAFFSQIKKLWNAGNLDRAEKLCKVIPGNPYADLVLVAIHHAHKPVPVADLALRETIEKLHFPLGRRINRFPPLALTASLVGMAGTHAMGGFHKLPPDVPTFLELPLPYFPFAFGGLLAVLSILMYLLFTGWTRRVFSRLGKLREDCLELVAKNPRNPSS